MKYIEQVLSQPFGLHQWASVALMPLPIPYTDSGRRCLSRHQHRWPTRQQRASRNMGVLRVMSKRGDDQVSWDTVAFVAGDPEAVAAVAEAQRLFTCARDAGVVAFAVDPTTKDSMRLVAFDVLQPQIVLIPRFIGG